MRLGIYGIQGKMGQKVLHEASKNASIKKVYGFLRAQKPDDSNDYSISASRLEFAKSVDVIIDFSSSEALKELLIESDETTTPIAIGTTALDDSAIKLIEQRSKKAPVLICSNFSIAVFACLEATAVLQKILHEKFKVRIEETHHIHKKDSPSGTALAFAKAALTNEIKSIREAEVIGVHEVIFESANEKISLKHESFSRQVYADGAIEAALILQHKPAGLYSLKDLLS